ncbi:MAG: hypothetical protein ABSF14_20720 [Terriglobia bacterium]
MPLDITVHGFGTDIYRPKITQCGAKNPQVPNGFRQAFESSDPEVRFQGGQQITHCKAVLFRPHKRFQAERVRAYFFEPLL